MENLFKRLYRYETKLHNPADRCNSAFIEQILHVDFFEFGRSGSSTNKEKTLRALMAGEDDPIYAENFQFSRISNKSVLITYFSYQLDETNMPIKQTNRSSLWVKKTAGQWQLRFHQGTPAKEDKTINTRN